MLAVLVVAMAMVLVVITCRQHQRQTRLNYGASRVEAAHRPALGLVVLAWPRVGLPSHPALLSQAWGMLHLEVASRGCHCVVD